MDEPSAAKRPSVLTIDRAAFLLLRVKRAFKKKRQQRKEKHAAAAAAAAVEALGGRRAPPPLLRSRTLPAIVAPGFSILHAQIDPQRTADITQSQLLCRGVSTHKVSGLRAHAPRISFTNKEESDTHELRRKSASSRLSSSPRTSIAGEDKPDGLVLRVPTPRGSVSSSSSVSTSSRIARLLSQGVRGTPEETGADTPRRLSWERRESAGQLPRSASIDSVVEAAICARHSEPSQSTLQLPRADRALSLVSPAVGRRAKSQRGQAGSTIGEEFRNRKGYFSINVQAVCNADLKLMNVVARWPGSAHDATIFNNSVLRAQCEEGVLRNCWLLGDSAYPNRSYLLTPLLNPTTSQEINYNEAHIKTRNTIERTFGVWKRRFPVISLTMRLSLHNIQAVIIATAVLHNICRNNNIVEVPPEVEVPEENEISVSSENLNNIPLNDIRHRQELISNYF